MTSLTQRNPGPDKRSAEMSDSDSDEPGHGSAGPAPTARAPEGARSFVDRRHQHAWVPGTAALLTMLIGLSERVSGTKAGLAASTA